MNRKSTPTRIALGQVLLLLAVLACARTLGFIPDQDQRIIAGRAAVCEAVAMHSAELAAQDEIKRLETTLARMVDRSPGMLSAGVRRQGSLVAYAADHYDRWKHVADDRSNDVQIQVPIWIGKQRWGRVEFCFEPLAYTGTHAWLVNPWVLHTVFVLASCYVAFTLYLSKKLDFTAASEAVSRPATEIPSSPSDDATKEKFDLSVALRQPPPSSEVPNRPSERHDTMTDVGCMTRPAYRSNDADAITSRLPTGDPVFREIVCGFVESLGAKILELHAAWDRRDLDEVVRLAHWIKGSGGTVGFDDFTQPSMQLQEAAQQGKTAEVDSVIAEIISLYQRINVSSLDALREDALA